MIQTLRILLPVLVAGVAIAAPAAAALPDSVPDPVLRALPASMPDPLPEQTGAVFGRVLHAETGDPLHSARVRVREVGRNELSHANGTFHFERLAPGTYTVVAERLGFAPAEARARVVANDTVHLVLELRPTAIEVAGVVVTGTGRERGAGEVYRPTSVLGDAELRRRLEATLPATIAREPGIHMRSFGAMATQPVIRGMGGDRVLVLEDGQRTGDLSSHGDDHGIPVDPLTAQRIEVVRGPAALLYGSSALGGVVNVIREDIPRTLPEAFTGRASLRGESVNRGLGGGGSVLLPVGPVALRGELTGRASGDVRTPLGTLEPTEASARDLSLGASLITGWGHAGVSVRDFASSYGVPGAFGGEPIPGGHPGGVEIDMFRRSGRLEVAHRTGVGPFASFELDAGVTHYLHDEIEGFLPDGTPFYGARFDNLQGTGSLIARHEHELGHFLTEGAFGLFVRGRDLRTRGASPGSRSATETVVAGFVYEELGIDPVRVQAGARYDWTRIDPYDHAPIRVLGREIPVSRRDFASVSGSLALLWEVGGGVTLGVNAARAFRTPAIEELFSDGPHLADFSFDIGNPRLEPEIGHGIDLFGRASLPGVEGELALFASRAHNYIYYAATGELDPRFERYPVFEARGEDAVFSGAEGRIQWEPARSLVVDATASYVRATRAEQGDPLPAIPPLNGSLEARYDADRWFASLGWDAAARQHRVPGPIPDPTGGGTIRPERPTPGYGLLNAGLGLRWSEGERFHTVTLKAHNLANTDWRDHLSRTKDVAPQAGRNVQLLYRVDF